MFLRQRDRISFILTLYLYKAASSPYGIFITICDTIPYLEKEEESSMALLLGIIGITAVIILAYPGNHFIER